MHLSIYFSSRLHHHAPIPAFPFLQMPDFDLRKQRPCQGRHTATGHLISAIKAVSSTAVHVQEESLLALPESPLLRLASLLPIRYPKSTRWASGCPSMTTETYSCGCVTGVQILVIPSTRLENRGATSQRATLLVQDSQFGSLALARKTLLGRANLAMWGKQEIQRPLYLHGAPALRANARCYFPYAYSRPI